MATSLRFLAVLSAGVMFSACSGSAGTTSSVTSEIAESSTSTSEATVAVSASSTTTPPPTVTTSHVSDPSLPGWDSWTLIYASLGTDESARADAEAAAGSIDGAAVLLSDDYPSLNPGYWVVYSGEWGSRDEASAWCPKSLGPNQTCYPRYLGSNIPNMLAGGAGLAQLDQGRLVVLDLESGGVLATFSDNFHWEAEYPSNFNLNADATELYFGMGWEDYWFSCETDGGQIWRLDLDSGVEEFFSPGWSPAMSPDGRFLAVVVAAECYPDPEVDGWVVSPGSQVQVFDLTDGDNRADYVLSVAQDPTSYDDPSAILRVTWDPATGNELLVTLADRSVRRVVFDGDTLVTDSPVEPNIAADTFAVASVDHLYTVEWDGDTSVVRLIDRDTGEIAVSYQVEGWVTGFGTDPAGQAIVTTVNSILLPSGVEVPIVGGVNNLDW